MPAVAVLPLGSASVISTYSDIASPEQTSSPQVLERSPSSSSSSTKEQQSGTCTMDIPEVGKDLSTSKGNDGVTPSERASGGAAQGQVKAAKSAALVGKDGNLTAGTVSPSQSTISSYPQAVPTPQQHGYYVYSSQFNPEPPSPHGGGPTIYDVGSFFQQQTAGFHNSPFGTVAGHAYGAQQPPNSPTSQSVGIPPASPLFPRMTGGPATTALLNASVQRDSGVNPALSPGPTYMTSHFGPSGMYMTPGGINGNGNNSNEDFSGWGDSRTISYPPSPQISAQGIPIPYVPGMPQRSASNERSGSFDNTMLQPSADSQLQHYGIGSPGQVNGAPGTLFAHQQPWGYGPPPPDMYGATSPLQPRPTIPYPGQLGGPPHRHHPPHPAHMAAYGGQFYPSTSPGPPIQTTASTKGPDGANLFIFHIPNHFTNMDMYNLFLPYGQLLSVRIMVEKDTGRSRGFGFVSYDSPDSAALAIKELNGFTIGNKRLKVQHKQIRPADMLNERNFDSGTFDPTDQGHQRQHTVDQFGRGGMNLPPSGPMAMSAGWYNRAGAGVPLDGSSDPHGGVLASHGMTADDPTSPTAVVPTGGAINPAGPDGPLDNDPLSSMEQLRQSLPEVGGAAASPTVVGE